MVLESVLVSFFNANLLCIVPILVYVLPKRARIIEISTHSTPRNHHLSGARLNTSWHLGNPLRLLPNQYALCYPQVKWTI